MGTKLADILKNDPARAKRLGLGQTVAQSASDVVNKGLGNTMSGTSTIAPPTPVDAAANAQAAPLPASAMAPAGATGTPAPNPVDEQSDQMISAAHKRLSEILNSVPDIDYEGKYHAAVQAAQQQPTPQAPGKLQSFAAALGSPQNAPGMLSQATQMQHAAQDQKFQRIQSLKEAIIHGDIQQAMAKGDFKRALAQSEELEKLHAHQERLAREQNFTMFKNQQDVLQGNRVELDNLRNDAAMARAKAIIAGRADLKAMSVKQQDMYAHEYSTTYRTIKSQKNVDGTPTYTDEQAQEMARQSTDKSFAQGERAPGSPGRVGGTGEVATTPPAGSAQETPLARQIRLNREAQKK